MTVSFERSHSIEIAADGETVLNYVSNPHSWPEWIEESHEITCDNRPMVTGDTFREGWATRHGPVELNWTVTGHEPGCRWVGEAETNFIGKIEVQYDIEDAAGGVRFIRTMRNPSRPKMPTDEQLKRIDEMAEQNLANIKRNIEKL